MRSGQRAPEDLSVRDGNGDDQKGFDEEGKGGADLDIHLLSRVAQTAEAVVIRRCLLAMELLVE